MTALRPDPPSSRIDLPLEVADCISWRLIAALYTKLQRSELRPKSETSVTNMINRNLNPIATLTIVNNHGMHGTFRYSLADRQRSLTASILLALPCVLGVPFKGQAPFTPLGSDSGGDNDERDVVMAKLLNKYAPVIKLS